MALPLKGARFRIACPRTKHQVVLVDHWPSTRKFNLQNIFSTPHFRSSRASRGTLGAQCATRALAPAKLKISSPSFKPAAATPLPGSSFKTICGETSSAYSWYPRTGRAIRRCRRSRHGPKASEGDASAVPPSVWSDCLMPDCLIQRR